MIGRLRGTLVERSVDSVVVDVSGVGYEVAMAGNDLGQLPGLGEEVVVHTHLYVREDQMTLFGFSESTGRNLFRVLLGASGIGPKIALAMLDTLGPDELRTAVLTDDVSALTAVPGIGNRTAQKLILDLRGRFDMPDGALPGDGSGGVAEVREALEGLGYGANEIREALAGIDTSGSVPDVLRAALQKLGTR